MWLGDPDERDTSIAFIKRYPRKSLEVVGIGCLLAFCYNVIQFALTKITSSLTNTVVGNMKTVLLISASALFLDHDSSVFSWICIGFFNIAICAYAYYTLRARGGGVPPPPAKPPAGAADSAEKGEASKSPATEKTRLVQ